MRYLSVKKFTKHQHYKNRRPPWIKLHVEVLDDYAFTCLQDASKAHLMLLWVLASKMDNRIPYDLPFLARKLGCTAMLDVEELVRQGFIELSEDDGELLASRKQLAMPETEAEGETEADSATKPRTRTTAILPASPEVLAVLAHYTARHPKRRPGPKERKIVARSLATYAVAELCEAIDGNADDPWCREKAKHELEYVLRDNGQVDHFRAKAERMAAERAKPIVDAHGCLTPHGERLTRPEKVPA